MKSVLVVDDSMFVRNRVKQALSAAGYSVDEAVNGKQALEKCSCSDFCCVVTDLVMPEMDGFGFLEALRSRDKGLPVVVLTADIQNTTRQRCEELGACHFLNKPIDTVHLLETVGRALAN